MSMGSGSVESRDCLSEQERIDGIVRREMTKGEMMKKKKKGNA